MKSNYHCFLDALDQGRNISILVALVLASSTIIFLLSEGKLNSFEIALATIGTLAGAAFMKVVFVFSLYQLLKRSEFPGSFLIMALLTGALFLLALVCLLSIASQHVERFPVSSLPLMLAVGYLLASIFVFLVFRLSHRIFRSRS